MNQELSIRYAQTAILTKRGMARKAALGKPQGPVPLGYRNCRQDGTKTVELADPETVRLVRQAFALAAEGLPLHKVLAEMTARGLRSRRGKALGPSALWGILNNPFYCGYIWYAGGLVPGQHIPIVDPTLLDLTVAKLSFHSRNALQSRPKSATFES